MYWHHTDWTPVDTTELATAFTLVRSSLPEAQRNAFHLSQAGHAGDGLPVSGVRVRRLPFHFDHWLYELDIATDSGSGARYASAKAFVVLVASTENSDAAPAVNIVPHLRSSTSAPETTFEAFVLDWTSATLHRLNHDVPALLMREGRFDRALATDYLDFFVSFLADSNEGIGSPFLLLRGGRLGDPVGIDSQPGLLPFEAAIGTYLLDGHTHERPARVSVMPEDARQTDPPDIAENDEHEDPVASGQATSDAAATGDPATPIADVAVVDEDAGQASVRLTATCQHRSVWFACSFLLHLPPEGGVEVSMLDDSPMGGVDPSLQQYQVGYLDDSGIRLLLLLGRRTEIAAAAFLDLLQAANADKPAPGARVENLRVLGNVDFRPFPTNCPIHAYNVEFLGRVSLDGCRRDADTIFENCRFALSLRARNCTIDGDLILRNSMVLGVTRNRDPLLPAICLSGLRITGDIDAAQLVADGNVDASGIRVEGSVILRGIDIRTRRREEPGLSLRHADVKAGIDLSPHVQGNSGDISERVDRSRIQGSIELGGLHCLQLDLRGAVCFSNINLSYANIRGPVDLGCFGPSGQVRDGDDSKRLMRTIVYGGIWFDYAKACELLLIGADIRSDLYLVGAEITGRVVAYVTQDAYRCKIGGKAIFSAARIDGDADFDGARIDGGFEMRTGSLGRLFMCLHPAIWVSGKRRIVDYFAAEIPHLEMSGVSRLNAIGLAGIQVSGRRDGVASLLLNQIDCADSIGLAWGLRQKVEFAQIEKWLDQTSELRRHLVVRRQVSERNCRSMVETGDVEFKRVSTGGYIDLTNLKLGHGSVMLNDTRIGTDLFARRSWLRGKDFSASKAPESFGLSLQCLHLDLDNARIGGDALLSGIDLDASHAEAGNFSIVGRGLEVGGRLELYNGGVCKARIPGGIDLSGARIGELSLPGEAELRVKRAADPAAKVGPVVLERAHLDSFGIDHPVPALNLTGIQVANWKLGLHRGSDDASDRDNTGTIISILEKMDPMDRSVWTGVEAELRNEAHGADADKVYRRMKDLEPASGWKRVGKWLYRELFGYGTNVWPALGLWLALTLLTFFTLGEARNVKLADSPLLQLGTQCTRLAPEQDMAPARCQAWRNAVDAAQGPGIELTAAQLDAAGVSSSYGRGDALLLGLRYAIPFIGGFGDSEWVPVEQEGAFFRHWQSPLAPSVIAAVTLLLNFLLLSFAAAFITRRWLR